MQIKSVKESKPSWAKKIIENDLYKVCITRDSKYYKRYYVDSFAYKNLFKYHGYKVLEEFFRELEDLNIDMINMPTEVISCCNNVRWSLQDYTDGSLDFNSLLPKLDLDKFMNSLNKFYDELIKLNNIDLTNINSNDIYYGNKIEIYNPEYIKIKKTDEVDNIKHINTIMLESLYRLDKFSECDESIEDILVKTLVGRETLPVLLESIIDVETKRNGKCKYLRHINNGYIR
jgi:hypothetical protein